MHPRKIQQRRNPRPERVGGFELKAAGLDDVHGVGGRRLDLGAHRVADVAAHPDPQWLPDYEKLSDGYMGGMLEAIVAFEIPVDRLETRWKLSQNRGREEMELIAAALENSPHAAERDLVPVIRTHLP